MAINKICVLLLFSISIILAGCWDRVEINDIAIVTAVGIDKTEDGAIRLSILIPMPKMISSSGESAGGGGSKTITIVFSDQGENIISAFRKLQEKLPREIVFSHIRFIVIGEKLAREGVSDALDFFTRYRQANLRAHILFTKENIDTVLKSEPGIERGLSNVIHEEGDMGLGIRTDLKDFLNMLTEEGMNPIAAQLAIVPMTAGEEAKKTYASIKGAAIFAKDKLVGWLSDEEVRGVLWFENEIKKGTTITVTIPDEKGGGKIGGRITRAKTALQPKTNGDELSIAISIDTELSIYDNSSKMDISNPRSIYFLENAIIGKIENRMRNTLAVLQGQGGHDVLGLGRAVYRRYPKEWREKYKDNWQEVFSRLDVEIAGKVSLVRVGFITNPLTRKEDEIKKGD